MLFECDCWECGSHVGASLGEHANLLQMAEQKGWKNLVPDAITELKVPILEGLIIPVGTYG